MNSLDLVKSNLITNDEYEENLLACIIDRISQDIFNLYLNAKKGERYTSEDIKKLTKEAKDLVSEYIYCIDDTNVGEILLLLSKLPSISNQICREIEKENNYSGVSQIIAHDCVDEYMGEIFKSGYDTLYENNDNKKIGINLYCECEKFVDALVLEFKQNLEPMINQSNLVFDDIIYLRRTLENLANRNDNYSFDECNTCKRDDCTYTMCSVLSRKNSHEQELYRYRKQIKVIDDMLKDGYISKENRQLLGNSKHDDLIRKLEAVAGNERIDKHKTIQFTGHSKIFSIISAERFGKILKKRYTEEAYLKDKDIYYMLLTGINPQEVFSGDSLLSKIEDIKNVYSDSESSK